MKNTAWDGRDCYAIQEGEICKFTTTLNSSSKKRDPENYHAIETQKPKRFNK